MHSINDSIACGGLIHLCVLCTTSVRKDQSSTRKAQIKGPALLPCVGQLRNQQGVQESAVRAEENKTVDIVEFAYEDVKSPKMFSGSPLLILQSQTIADDQWDNQTCTRIPSIIFWMLPTYHQSIRFILRPLHEMPCTHSMASFFVVLLLHQ